MCFFAPLCTSLLMGDDVDSTVLQQIIQDADFEHDGKFQESVSAPVRCLASASAHRLCLQ